jgi:DnaJ-class molecular chaperone
MVFQCKGDATFGQYAAAEAFVDWAVQHLCEHCNGKGLEMAATECVVCGLAGDSTAVYR